MITPKKHFPAAIFTPARPVLACPIGGRSMPGMVPLALRPAFNANSADLTARLEAWSTINSGSDHLAGLTRMADALETSLRELTADVARVPLDANGRAALRARSANFAETTPARRVLCSGHYDTVFGERHPFQRPTRIDADTLRGPGVADMKGGIVVMLAALTAVRHELAAASLGWEILLTPDEETGSAASRPLIEAVARDHTLALIFEPARPDGSLVRSRKGTGIFTVTSHGRAAHAGNQPAQGRNAILALAEFLLSARDLPAEIPGLLLNVGSIRGGGPAVNIVPDFATADLDVRASTPDAAETVARRLAELAAPIQAREGHRLEISGGFNRPPMAPTADTEHYFALLQACARKLDLPAPAWTDVGGGSDGNLLAAAGLTCLDGLGPIGGGLHSADEYVHLPSLAERARLTALFLHRLAAAGRP